MSDPEGVVVAEGRAAFLRGDAATSCPYAFVNTPCWETKDYDGFNVGYRHKMNAWMNGWIAAKKKVSA